MEKCEVCERPKEEARIHNPLCAHILALDARVTALEQEIEMENPGFVPTVGSV